MVLNFNIIILVTLKVFKAKLKGKSKPLTDQLNNILKLYLITLPKVTSKSEEAVDKRTKITKKQRRIHRVNIE